MSEISIRPGRASDFPAITALYNRFVEETAVNFDVAPFSLEERAAWFSQFSETGRYRLFVAETAGAFAGYAASMRHKEKRGYETSVEATVYVEPASAGRGVGGALYQVLFDRLKGEDIRMVLAGVALPNEASLRLHKSFGFVEVGTFHEVGHKFGRYWDVLWLEKRF